MLHRLERKGLLRSRERIEASKVQRVYRATREGGRALRIAKENVRERFGELFKKELSTRKSGKRQSKG